MRSNRRQLSSSLSKYLNLYGLSRFTSIFFLVVLSVITFFHYRSHMNPDGISYLSVAREYLSGNLWQAINGYWSLSYTLILTLVLGTLKPNAYFLFPVAHFSNLILVLIGIVGFDLFTHQWITRVLVIIDPVRRAGAYLAMAAFFFYGTFGLVGLNNITPDLMALSLSWWLFYFLTKLGLNWSLRTLTITVMIIWIGTLTRTVFLYQLPLLLLLCIALGYSQKKLTKHLGQAVLVLGTLLAISIGLVSLKYGELTISANGKLNYAWYVNGTNMHIHWQGSDNSGQPVHTTNQLLKHPQLYEFSKPLPGTYPVWYDPWYWHQGIKTQFNAREHSANFVNNLQRALKNVSKLDVLATLVVMVLSLRLAYKNPKANSLYFGFVLINLFGVFVYLNGLYEARYIGFYTAFIYSLLTANLFTARGIYLWINGMMVALLLVFVVKFSLIQSISRITRSNPQHSQYLTGQKFSQAGIAANSKVAVIGNSFTLYFLHLLGAQIIAEVPEFATYELKDLSAEQWQGMMRAFESTGADGVISLHTPQQINDWVEVEPGMYWYSF